jgi:hypothetical protein
VRKRNLRYLKRTHKIGIKLPKTIKEALALDKKNGNTFWADAIAKEMKDVSVAFKILLDRQSAPISYQKIPCHMIFDIKMEIFLAQSQTTSEGQNFDLAKYIVSSTRYEYSIQYIVSYDTIHCF